MIVTHSGVSLRILLHHRENFCCTNAGHLIGIIGIAITSGDGPLHCSTKPNSNTSQYKICRCLSCSDWTTESHYIFTEKMALEENPTEPSLKTKKWTGEQWCPYRIEFSVGTVSQFEMWFFLCKSAFLANIRGHGKSPPTFHWKRRTCIESERHISSTWRATSSRGRSNREKAKNRPSDHAGRRRKQHLYR